MTIKEYILDRLTILHVKLFYGRHYDLNTVEGLTVRIEDLTKYEQLQTVVRENPDWDNEEFSKELSERIRKKTTLH